MKPKKWKVTVYVTDKGYSKEDEAPIFLDPQVIEVYLACGFRRMAAPEVTWKIGPIQELKA